MDVPVRRKVSTPRQARSEQKREALMASGRALMMQRGFERITTHEIAAHAGVSDGTFYRYFTDKADLATHLIRDHIDRYFVDFGDFETSLAPDISPIDRVTEKVLTHLRWAREFPLASVIRQVSMSNPEFRERIERSRREATERLADQVRVLQRYGVAWPDLDPRLTAVTIMALAMAITETETSLLGGEEVVARHLAKSLVRMLLRPAYHR